MADAIPAWGDLDRQRLVLARLARGDNQEECAQMLRGMGSSGANQGSVSRWETGLIKRPRARTVEALRAYSAGVELPTDDACRTSPTEETAAASVGSPSEPFDAVVRGLTDEPLLGPRQAAFVDAVTDRLRDGPAMSDADDRARMDQMRILGLSSGQHDVETA